jgi:histidine triad (HIT) family protein
VRTEGCAWPRFFTRIIECEVPVRFVWRDDLCAAFLNITPLSPRHALVVPEAEVEDWLDLEPLVAAHLMPVSEATDKTIREGFGPEKVGLAIAGLKVLHAHSTCGPYMGPCPSP